MIALLQTRLGGLRGEGIPPLLFKIILATLAMGVILAFGISIDLSATGAFVKFARVLLPGAMALLVYVIALKLLRVREAEQVWALVRAKLVR